MKNFLSFIFILSSLASYAQQQPNFVASIEPAQVVIGNYCKASFTLQNADAAQFAPPQFPDFDIIHRESGPSYSFGTFGFTKSVVYSYYLRPKKLGTFSIGPATAKVGGKTYRTKTLIVKVVSPGDPGTPEDLMSKIREGKGIFLMAKVRNSEAYLGEQIIVDYTLYTSVGIERYNITEESVYSGFYAQNIQRFDGTVYEEEIDGKKYKTKVLQRVALFPQKTGLLSIGPMNLNISVKLAGSGKSLRQTISSSPVELKVKPLPVLNKPEDFTGAVGSYSLQHYIRNSTLTTDDALTLGLILTGYGDLKQIQAPVFDFGEEFEIYDPTIIERNYQEDALVAGSKTFEYTILPRKPGNYELQPSISYFNRDSLRYIRLAPEPIHVNVGLGKNPLPEEITEESLEKPSVPLPIKEEISLTRRGSSFFGSAPFWILYMLPIPLLGVLFAFEKKNQKLMALGAKELRRRKAKSEAKMRLSHAKEFLDQGSAREFFSELFHALNGYISDKFKIPASDLSVDQVQEILSRSGIDAEIGKRYQDVLGRSQTALFAGMYDQEFLEKSLAEAESVIEEIENKIPVL